jgi:hypothetical protein
VKGERDGEIGPRRGPRRRLDAVEERVPERPPVGLARRLAEPEMAAQVRKPRVTRGVADELPIVGDEFVPEQREPGENRRGDGDERRGPGTAMGPRAAQRETVS